MKERSKAVSPFDLGELQANTLTSLAVCTAFIGYALFTVVTGMDTVSVFRDAWLGAGALLFVPIASLSLRYSHQRLASTLLIGAIIAAIALATPLLAWKHACLLYLIPISFTGVLLGEFAFFLILFISIFISLFGMVGMDPPGLGREGLYSIGVILLVSGACWLSLRNLNTALHWLWQAYGIAQENARIARQRRAELRRALDALTEATRRLERTNRELTVARRETEEASVLQEQFVANVSHEIRTPLNLVVGFAELLYLSPESYDDVVWTPDLVEDIGAMFRAGRQLQNLIDDILDLSRINAARLPMFREQTQLEDLIHETVEAMAPLFEQHGLPCTVHVPNKLPSLFVDRTRIRQVLVNLLNNAVRFTDSGTISVTASLGPDAVTVAVRDTGMGIDDQEIEHVFEEFRQVDGGLAGRGGAGLGLTISRQFVQLHGGRMWVKSALGQGSTFSFALPLPGQVTTSGPLVRVPDRRAADLSEASVIVVDRDPTVAQMLSRYLGDHRVLSACTADESDLLIAEEHPMAIVINQAPGSAPEEWLGATGQEAEHWGVPTIRCSIPSPSWIAQNAGIRGCLTKPVSQETLLQAVHEAMSAPGDILLVDDDPGFVSLIGRMLKGSDRVRRLLTAYGGAQALELIRSQPPDLVLLDLLMPEVDGFEVLDQLRAEGSLEGLRVLAVTATSYAEEALRRRGSYYTVTQTDGLTTAHLTELLRTTLEIVHPDYARDLETSPGSR